MSFPTVYYITQVIPSCYSAGYAMCVCVSFGACVYRSLASSLLSMSARNGYPIRLLYVWIVCSIPMHEPQKKLTFEPV